MQRFRWLALLPALLFAAHATPPLQLLPVSKTGEEGTVKVVAHLDTGGVVTAAQVHIAFDPTKVVFGTHPFIPGAGWTTNDSGITNGSLFWSGSNANGASSGTTLFTLTGKALNQAQSVLTLKKDSNFADGEFNQYSQPADQDLSFPPDGSPIPPALTLISTSVYTLQALVEPGSTGKVTGAEVHLHFNTEQVTVNPATAFTPGPGWQQTSAQVIGSEVIWIGQTTQGGIAYEQPAVTITVGRRPSVPTTVSLTPDSKVTDSTNTSYSSGITQQVALPVISAPPSFYTAGLGATKDNIGIVQVSGQRGGATTLTEAEVHFAFDPAKVAIAHSAASFVPGDGWTQDGYSVSDNEAVWDGHFMGGTYQNFAPIVSVYAKQLSSAGSTLTLTTSSFLGDEVHAQTHPASPIPIDLAAVAPPSLSLQPATRNADGSGQVQIVGNLGGAQVIGAAQIFLRIDPAPTTLSASSIIPGPGWTRNDYGLYGNTVTIALSHVDDTATDGDPVVTVRLQPNGSGATRVTLGGESNIADNQFNAYPVPFDQTVTLLPGMYRNLRAAISGAPSAGPGGTVAVAVGDSLRLLNAADLSDVPGFNAVALDGPLEGRPAFGVVNGQMALAAGTTKGTMDVVNAATGAALSTPLHLGSSVSTPAIDSRTGNIYAGANQVAGNALLVRVQPDGTTTQTPLSGARVTSSPAFLGGGVVIGTGTAIELFRDTGSGPLQPQATITDEAGFNTSPVLASTGTGMVTAGGNVYQFDVVRGAVAGSHLALGALLSQGWYDSSTATWAFGGGDGHVYTVKAGAGGPVLVGNVPVSNKPIAAQALELGGVVYALDAAGGVSLGSPNLLSLGGPSTTALAATGRHGSLIVSEMTGGLASLPF